MPRSRHFIPETPDALEERHARIMAELDVKRGITPEKRVKMDKERDAVIAGVETIVAGVKADAMDTVSGKRNPYAGLVADVDRLDDESHSQRMEKRVLRVLKDIYGRLLHMGVKEKFHFPDDETPYDEADIPRVKAEWEALGNDMVIPSEIWVVDENMSLDPVLMAIAAKVYKKFHSYDEDAGDIFWTADKILRILNAALHESVLRKRTAGQMDLNDELLLLRYLGEVSMDEDVTGVLAETAGVLHHHDLEKEHILSGHRDDILGSLEYLTKRGKYRELLAFREKYATTRLPWRAAGDLIIDAHAKAACYLKFDENGMPFSNDATPQYDWADFAVYRKWFMDEREVPQELEVVKRASVAELLRKLVNRDLDYGEGSDADSTSVGMFSGDLDVRHIRIVTREFDNAFEATGLPLRDLFKPIEDALNAEMEAFGKILVELYGERFIVLPSRVKSLESTLLKMLKEKMPDGVTGKTTVGSITDLIGFTVLTDTEKQAEKVYAEVKAMMKGSVETGEIKEFKPWAKPKKSGYQSMDVTGVPDGFTSRIQVQCRTKAMDASNFGKMANHTAYKVESGEVLLAKINANPDVYLDQLYKAVHNLRQAFDLVRNEKNDQDLAVLLKIYGVDYTDGMSLVRTSMLY